MLVFTGLGYCGEISSYRTKESVAVLFMEFWMGTVFIHGIILIMGQTKIAVSAVWINCITYAHNDVTSYPCSTMWLVKIQGHFFFLLNYHHICGSDCTLSPSSFESNKHVNWIQPKRQTQWWYYLFQAGPASITWSPFFCKVSDGALHVMGIH